MNGFLLTRPAICNKIRAFSDEGTPDMPDTRSSTRFFAAERSTMEDLQRQRSYFLDGSFTRHLLDAIPSILLILNHKRQVVYGNRTLLTLLGARDEDFIYGLRPGEILRCVNAGRNPAGCGTSEYCRTCGMAAAILSGLSGKKETRECSFLRQLDGKTEAIDLLVWATPLEFEGEPFTVFALSDISHEKRRRALERIFFHDVLNVVGSIRGLTELLQTYDPADRRDIYEMIAAAAEQTIEEIEGQRLLAAAENKELQLRPGPVNVPEILQQLVETYRHHEVGRERQVTPEGDWPETGMVSDRALLLRILGNMLKNALEASAPGETVTVGAIRRGGRIEFRVRNRAVIPAEVQTEIFQRSFSTKGSGRGLGTYGMKLLSEYLQGEIFFTSTTDEGTIFHAVFPLVIF